MGISLVSLAFLTISQVSVQTSPARSYTFEVQGRNITAEYRSEWDALSDARIQTLLSELRRYKIIMVPGFFSNNIIALSQLPLAQHFRWGEQFEDYMNWFKENEISFDRLKIESEAEPEFNAPLIRDAILNSTLPVILIAQSKGCNDSLTALLKYPEIQARAKIFLPLNAAFRGTPLANDAIELNYARDTISWMLDKLGGSLRSVESLRVEDSEKYLKDHAQEIKTLLESKPLISFAARIPKDSKRWNTNFAIPRDYLEYRGYINDGLLPWQSSILPGSEYILAEGMDHATSIRYSKVIPFDRIHFLQTMLWMLRKRLPDQQY